MAALPAVLLALLPLAVGAVDPPSPAWPPHGWPHDPCPCGDLCRPLPSSQGAARRAAPHVFAFHPGHLIYNGSDSEWRQWDWSTLTTVAVWSFWSLPDDSWALLCHAHRHNVRVVVPFHFPEPELANSTARSAWIAWQVEVARHLGIDGLNLDVSPGPQPTPRSTPPHPAQATTARQPGELNTGKLSATSVARPNNATLGSSWRATCAADPGVCPRRSRASTTAPAARA